MNRNDFVQELAAKGFPEPESPRDLRRLIGISQTGVFT